MKYWITLVCTLACYTLLAQPLQHVWTNRVGGPADAEKLWRCAVDESGNVYATSGFRGTFSDQGSSVTSNGGLDILRLKYDPDSQLLWARSAGGPYDDVAHGVESDIFGNFFLCGDVSGQVVFTNDTVTCASQDMYVCKISPQVPQSVVGIEVVAADLRLWPNPAAEHVFVENPGRERARLDVWDATGRLVSTQVVQPGVDVVEVGQLSDGLYHAVLVSGAIRTSQHLMIEH